MSFATTIRPSPTWTPFFRMSASAAFIVAMSLFSALNSASPMVDDGLFRNASILSASGRSFAVTFSLTAASASERFRRAVHRERLARHEVVHLGLEDGSDVGIGVLAVCREIDGEVLHLPGQMVDLHRTAVADHGELVHPVYQVFADALVLRVRAAHLRLVPDDRIHDLADLPEQGGEVLLRLDGRGDCLASRRLEVVLSVRADGGGKLPAGELVEGLERLRGSVGRLCEKLERVLVEKPLVHKRLEGCLYLLAVKALGRGHCGLHQEYVQLRDHLSDGLLALVHRRVCALLLNLLRLGSLRLRGIDAAKEVVHRHVVDVDVRNRHGNISFPFSAPCIHATRQKVTAKLSEDRPLRRKDRFQGAR